MKRYLYVLLVIALFTLQACTTDAAPVESDEAAGSLIQPASSDSTELSLEGSAGAANGQIVSPAECAAVDTKAAQLAADILILVNQERSTNGLGAVTLNAQLTQAAQAHSLDMGCKFFLSHTGSDNSSPADRISRAGYLSSVWAENVAAGYTYSTASAVMAGWMNSAGHKANILNPSVTEMGIGYVYNASDPNRYRNYWTMVLAAPK